MKSMQSKSYVRYVIDISSNLKLGQSDIMWSKRLKIRGVALYENLSLNYQIAAVKNKAVGVLINTSE